jgi:hypothetical protein
MQNCQSVQGSKRFSASDAIYSFNNIGNINNRRGAYNDFAQIPMLTHEMFERFITRLRQDQKDDNGPVQSTSDVCTPGMSSTHTSCKKIFFQQRHCDTSNVLYKKFCSKN